MAVESVLTPFGWKLVGEIDPAITSVQYSARPDEVIVRENIPSAETIALAAAQPNITWEDWNRYAVIQTDIALEQGQAVVDLRKAIEETAKITKTTPSTTPLTQEFGNRPQESDGQYITATGEVKTHDTRESRSSAGYILAGLALAALAFGRGHRRVSRRVRRG